MPVPHVSLNQRRLTAAVAAVLGLTLASVEGGQYTWVPGTAGAWSTGANWTGGVAPVGNNPADVLIFGGTPPALGSTITDDISGTFLLNSLQFQTTEGSGVLTLAAAAGSSLRFGGSNAQILQNGGGNVTLKVPISSTSNLEFGGTGASNLGLTTSVVTLDGGISGVFDITKNGANTFRFGSLTNTASSDNTWIGTLTINGGAIRFNNNAPVAPTALRSNPVVLSAGASLSTQVTEDSSLRFGTLSGSGGTVSGTTGASNSVDIVITALQDGSFGGTISNTGGTNDGKLIVRGTGSQTFTGTTQFAKDVIVGRGATLTLAGTATLGSQATNGSVILNGGTFQLDNSQVNNPNRLRDGDVGSTGLDTVGGGTFSLIGNAAGTTEQVARLQLGTSTKPRSGALTINVTQPANATGATVLNIQSYSRDSTQQSYATVNFTSNSTLGVAGVSPRIVFNGTAPTLQSSSGLLNGTNIGANDVGWATVNGSSFATHVTTLGITAVSTKEFGATDDTSSTQNIRLGGAAEISTTTNYQRSSLKLEPSAAGQQLSLSSSGHLQTGALLLAGDTDFSISNTGTGAGGWNSAFTRYAYIQSATLSLNVKLVGNGALVKSGAGTLALTNSGNEIFQQPVAINEGILRATPGTSLPRGEIRFRGGILELQGDGVNTTTFTRQLGNGVNKVTWSGVDTTGVGIGDDRGSGGFAAIGSDANVSITGPNNSTSLAWEDTGFVSSGYALTFGSRSADRMVTWTSNINLSDVTGVGVIQNYNAREFRVIDNSAVTTDRARISGTISGSVRNDLLKTGDGVLELSGNNSFSGATIVQEGTLLVNGTTNSSFLTDVRNGATLGGRGTVGAVRVGAGATIAPGELAGVTGQTSKLTLLKGDLSFAGPTSKLRFELAAGSYDQLDVQSGGVMLQGAELVGSLLNGFLAAQGDLFFLIINDGTDAVQGTFAQGSSVQVGGQMFEISYTGDFDNQKFTGGNDVVLRAIPEPSSALLLGGGLAMLAARRRKRR